MSFNRNTIGSITRKSVNTNININRNISINNNKYRNINTNRGLVNTSSNYQQPIEQEFSSDFTKIYSIHYNKYVGNKLTIPDDIGVVLHDFSINLIPKKKNSIFKVNITINYNCSSHFNSYINLQLKYKKTTLITPNNDLSNNDLSNNDLINNDLSNNDLSNNDLSNNDLSNNDLSYNINDLVNEYNNDISHNNFNESYSLGNYYLGTGSTSFLYNVFNASCMTQITSTNKTLINFYIVAKIYNTQDDIYYDMSITDEFKPVILFDVIGNTFLVEEINT